MILQGANDPRVLQIESDEMVKAARGSGVYVSMCFLKTRVMVLLKNNSKYKDMERFLFLDKYLKL